MVDMDGDWPLPRPAKPFKKHDKSFDSSELSKTSSVASGFTSLATPLVVEAIQRARDLKDNCGAEEFHQLRVAFRKLRALYWAYSLHLGSEVAGQATEEFKRLAAAAGGARDWDIATSLLKTAQASRASMGMLIEAALVKRELAVANSQVLIKGDDVEVFLTDALRRAQSTLEASCDELLMGAFAKDRIQQAKRALKKRCKTASSSKTHLEEDLHDVRKAGKKVRYLLEFFQPIVKRDQGRMIKHLTDVQKKLGEFNDLSASEVLIRDTVFNDVPVEVVQESLQWLEKQKYRRMQAAMRQVLAISD